MSDTTRRRPDGRLILLLGALAACGPLSIDMYLPSLPSLAASFGTSPAAAQSTLTSFMFGFSFGMLLYGPMSDAYGRRPRVDGRPGQPHLCHPARRQTPAGAYSVMSAGYPAWARSSRCQ